jgi:hypothetical protein
MKYPVMLAILPLLILSACTMVEDEYYDPYYTQHYHEDQRGNNRYYGHIDSSSGRNARQGFVHGHPDANEEIIVSGGSGLVHGHGEDRFLK